MSKNLLLLSSSRVGKTEYLQHALLLIKEFLSIADYSDTKPLLFIPYAGVSVDFDQYELMVKEALKPLRIEINSIHRFENKLNAIENAGGIVIGGGNTFALLHSLYQFELLEPIKKIVFSGIPYIGWSAGSNIAGPTIRTTNDMPIIEPPSFSALELIEWQINPHYIDGSPPGHNGETRQQRLEEFLVLNNDKKVIGIPEGTALRYIRQKLEYFGGTEISSRQDNTIKTGFVFTNQGKSTFTTTKKLNEDLERHG